MLSCGNNSDACITLMILALTCSCRTPVESVPCTSGKSEQFAGTDGWPQQWSLGGTKTKGHSVRFRDNSVIMKKQKGLAYLGESVICHDVKLCGHSRGFSYRTDENRRDGGWITEEKYTCYLSLFICENTLNYTEKYKIKTQTSFQSKNLSFKTPKHSYN